jgi:hypothetical protein
MIASTGSLQKYTWTTPTNASDCCCGVDWDDGETTVVLVVTATTECPEVISASEVPGFNEEAYEAKRYREPVEDPPWKGQRFKRPMMARQRTGHRQVGRKKRRF